MKPSPSACRLVRPYGKNAGSSANAALRFGNCSRSGMARLAWTHGLVQATRRMTSARARPTTMPTDARSTPSLRVTAVSSPSVERERLLPVSGLGIGRLIGLQQDAILEDQDIHPGPHEAAPAVLRRADDRFTTDVEARIDEHRASALLPER